MSCVEVRERVRDSPLRARSLFTVRAAISSARSSERPCSFWLSLMCSYCRARFVPFLTPAGGMVRIYPEVLPGTRAAGDLLAHEARRGVRAILPREHAGGHDPVE